MRKRYPSDVTDEHWARVAPIFELARRGRPRTVPAREIVNAILYVMKNGCAWRALPHDFPKWQTVFVQRWRWTAQGVLARAVDALRPEVHRPSVGIIDSTCIESAVRFCGLYALFRLCGLEYWASLTDRGTSNFLVGISVALEFAENA